MRIIMEHARCDWNTLVGQAALLTPQDTAAPEGVVRLFALSVVRALVYLADNLNTFHRDVKPANGSAQVSLCKACLLFVASSHSTTMYLAAFCGQTPHCTQLAHALVVYCRSPAGTRWQRQTLRFWHL